MTTWASGMRITPPRLNDTLLVYKSADTPRASNAVISADPHLTVTVDANSVYTVDLSAAWTANTLGDVQWSFTLPAGATLTNYRHLVNDGTANAAGSVAAAGSTIQARSGITSTDYLMVISGTLITTSSGTFSFGWAQNVSNASATIFRAGSYMRLYRIT